MPICYINKGDWGGLLDIIITEWALQSYLDLYGSHAFSDEDYWTKIRPAVKLLKDGIPSTHTEFQNHKFWSVAEDKFGRIPGGYKMKWHNLNDGKTPQLRLGVIIWEDVAFLCRAYTDKTHEFLELGRLRVHAEKIQEGQFTYRGVL